MYLLKTFNNIVANFIEVLFYWHNKSIVIKEIANFRVPGSHEPSALLLDHDGDSKPLVPGQVDNMALQPAVGDWEKLGELNKPLHWGVLNPLSMMLRKNQECPSHFVLCETQDRSTTLSIIGKFNYYNVSLYECALKQYVRFLNLRDNKCSILLINIQLINNSTFN